MFRRHLRLLGYTVASSGAAVRTEVVGHHQSVWNHILAEARKFDSSWLLLEENHLQRMNLNVLTVEAALSITTTVAGTVELRTCRSKL